MTRIIADIRESLYVVDALKELSCDVVEEMLAPADYVISENFAVERKTFRDFLKSVYDKRIFDQVERMRETYDNSCLIVEGDITRGLARIRNPRVFYGALAKIIVEWGVSVIFALDEEQTAQFLFSLARKMEERGRERIIARHKPKTYTMRQRQLLAAQGLPHVGPKMADKLLSKFGSVRRLFSASKMELLSVEGIGKKTASDIKKFLDLKYTTHSAKR
jgi:ERCC4-type nuclease